MMLFKIAVTLYLLLTPPAIVLGCNALVDTVA